MEINNIAAAGAILKTGKGTILLQKRDIKVPLNAGKVALFGGKSAAKTKTQKVALRLSTKGYLLCLWASALGPA